MAFLPTPGPMELIIILVIVLLLFGPKKLPQLGKSLGKTVKAIREGVEGKNETAEDQKVEAKADKTDDDDSEDTVPPKTS
ncbi:MAG: twin-arginine translocase TatA/TatE family subunit [Actinobacteria bacterium]|nr:twin-arginine translocase TatA/TatE family subunit [Actinomycetota bacterium]MCL5888305.1 twin-arginine translocase TatA/TatE family subunit [Actinomycetota bacterium]